MTPNEIKARGYEPIESEQQLRALPRGFYFMLWPDGAECRWIKDTAAWIPISGNAKTSEYIKKNMVGFRHVPDAVPEPEAAGGFEKKTHFWGVPLSELMEFDDWLAKGTAKHIRDCHTHIDQQAAEIARLRDEASKWETTSMGIDNQLTRALKEIEALKAQTVTDGIPLYEDFSGLPDTAPVSGKLRKRNFFIFKDTTKRERDLIEHIKECYAEIDRLQSSREWVAIESAEQLDDATAGTYEVIDPSGVLAVAVKRKTRWTIPGFSLTVSPEDFFAMRPSHYRLITRAEDFTPPERRFKLNGEYSRAEIMELLGENE